MSEKSSTIPDCSLDAIPWLTRTESNGKIHQLSGSLIRVMPGVCSSLEGTEEKGQQSGKGGRIWGEVLPSTSPPGEGDEHSSVRCFDWSQH